MPKLEIKVDKEKIVQIIEKMDSSQKFDNLNALYKAIANEYNALPEIIEKISFSIVMLRIEKWGITLKTKPGRVISKTSDDNQICPSLEAIPEGYYLNLYPDYRLIRSDSLNFTLENKVNNQWKRVGYYGKVNLAISTLVANLFPTTVPLTDLNVIANALTEIVNNIKQGIVKEGGIVKNV